MKNKFLVSVILPVYNGDRFISDSIQSILDQTVKDLEIIVINDGSTDNTKKIVEGFTKQNDKIKLINNEHSGLTFSLNHALNISAGKYIVRQDADDFSKKNRIELQLKWFLEKSNRVLCGTNCEILSGEKIKKNWSIDFKHKNIIKKLSFSNCFVHSSVMFLREAAEKVNFYDADQKFSQDYDLWWKLSTLGEVGNLKEKLVFLRERKDSISSINMNEQTEYFIKSCIKYYAVMNKIISLKDKKELEFYCENKITKDYLNIMRYFYNDKLNEKISFNDLTTNQKLMSFSFLYLSIRKAYLFFKGILK